MMCSLGPLDRRQTRSWNEKDASHRFIDFQVAEA